MALTPARRLPGWSRCDCAGLLARPNPSVRVEREPHRFAPWSDAAPAYRLGVGDRLKVDYPADARMTQEAVVEPDGVVSLRVAGRVAAQNLTRGRAGGRGPRRRPPRRLRQPIVSLSVDRGAGGAHHRRRGGPEAGRLSAAGARLDAGGGDAGRRLLAREPDGSGGRHPPAAGRPPCCGPSTCAASSPAGDGAKRIVLASEDIVFVPRSRIAEVDLWIDQYVNRAAAVQPVGLLHQHLWSRAMTRLPAPPFPRRRLHAPDARRGGGRRSSRPADPGAPFAFVVTPNAQHVVAARTAAMRGSQGRRRGLDGAERQPHPAAVVADAVRPRPAASRRAATWWRGCSRVGVPADAALTLIGGDAEVEAALAAAVRR